MSYASFGLAAPFYQDFDLPDDLEDNNYVNLALRTIKIKPECSIFVKDIKTRPFLIKYKNFIQSPRSHFIYEKVDFVYEFDQFMHSYNLKINYLLFNRFFISFFLAYSVI